jgi:hypothetical protein
MATLRAGSEIHYFVSDKIIGGEPIANTKTAINDLKAFCKEHRLILKITLGD